MSTVLTGSTDSHCFFIDILPNWGLFGIIKQICHAMVFPRENHLPSGRHYIRIPTLAWHICIMYANPGVALLIVIFLLISVLEFELRKAQDTIKSLRASLTKTAGKRSSSYCKTHYYRAPFNLTHFALGDDNAYITGADIHSK